MIHIIRRLALAAAMLMLAACTASSVGTGTTAERGIGGTGGPAREADRGIGGTGVQTGIVGAITGFGSIRVNGLEIADDTVHDIAVDGVARPVETLQIGQIARIVATTETAATGTDSTAGLVLRARAVAIEHDVVGPVQRQLGPGVFQVAGQTVRITSRTVGAEPAVGQFVAVSGLRDSQAVVTATRLDAMPAGDVIVAGHLVPTPSGWRIGKLGVAVARDSNLGGQRVRVVGRLVGGVLVPRTLAAAPLVPPLSVPNRLIVQAYVEASGDVIRLGEDEYATRGPEFGALPPDGPAVVSITRAADGHMTAIGVLGGAESGGRGAGPGGALQDPAAHGASTSSAAGAGGHAATSGSATSGTGGTSGAGTTSPRGEVATVGAPASPGGGAGRGTGASGGHGAGDHGGGGGGPAGGGGNGAGGGGRR